MLLKNLLFHIFYVYIIINFEHFSYILTKLFTIRLGGRIFNSIFISFRKSLRYFVFKEYANILILQENASLFFLLIKDAG